MQFTTIHWTPGFQEFEAPAAPRDRSERVCYLITDDPLHGPIVAPCNPGQARQGG